MYCIDASVVVNSVIEKEAHHEYSLRLINHIVSRNSVVVVPNIIIPEVGSAISRGTGSGVKANEFIRNFIEMPNFTFIPIDKELAMRSAELASKYGLRGADSLYAAVAYQFGCKLITLDETQRKNVKKIIVALTPKEELRYLK